MDAHIFTQLPLCCSWILIQFLIFTVLLDIYISKGKYVLTMHLFGLGLKCSLFAFIFKSVCSKWFLSITSISIIIIIIIIVYLFIYAILIIIVVVVNGIISSSIAVTDYFHGNDDYYCFTYGN